MRSGFTKIVIACFIFTGSLFSQEQPGEKFLTVSDKAPSVLRGFKLEDLADFQKYYKVQIDRLVAEKDSLRRQGIADLETINGAVRREAGRPTR